MSIADMPCVTVEQVTRLRAAAMKQEAELLELREFKANVLNNEGTIYNVFHYEDCVGSFLQGSFSTRAYAEHYVKNNPERYPLEEMSVCEYELDNSLSRLKGGKDANR